MQITAPAAYKVTTAHLGHNSHTKQKESWPDASKMDALHMVKTS